MLWIKVGFERRFADECDLIATKATENIKHKHWGRWYLTEKPFCLNTKMIRPNFPGGIYDIELNRIGPNGESDGSSYTWMEHLSEKNWIGQKG